jgi:hypothetical protein
MAKCAVLECENEAVWSGHGQRKKYCSEACKQKAKRVRSEQERITRLRAGRCKLYVVPCDLDTANAFVSLHHRHHKPVPGAKFSLAVIDEPGLLRGVAILGRPVSRMLDDSSTLEVNRVAVDGCSNACSALYGAARKAAFAMGYARLITYTLVTESGSSLRGAGWQRVKETQAKEWSNLKRPRQSSPVYQINKWRWETINPEFERNRDRPRQIVLPEAMQEKPQPDLFSGQWQ